VVAPADTSRCQADCAAELAELSSAASGDGCAAALDGWLACVGALDCIPLQEYAFRYRDAAPQVACTGLRDALPCPSATVGRLVATLYDASGRLAAAMACEELEGSIAAAAAAASASADRSCTVDQDCTLGGGGVSCAGSGCGHPLSVASNEEVERKLEALDAERCPDFEAMGCQSREGLHCGPPRFLACQDGLCTLVDEPPP
jgi:hypothetical protein